MGEIWLEFGHFEILLLCWKFVLFKIETYWFLFIEFFIFRSSIVDSSIFFLCCFLCTLAEIIQNIFSLCCCFLCTLAEFIRNICFQLLNLLVVLVTDVKSLKIFAQSILLPHTFLIRTHIPKLFEKHH